MCPYSSMSLLAPIELTGLYKNESIETFPKKLNQIACEIHIQPGHYGATRLDPGTYPAGCLYGFALAGGGTPLSDRDSRRGSNGGNWLASASLSRQATTAGGADKPISPVCTPPSCPDDSHLCAPAHISLHHAPSQIYRRSFSLPSKLVGPQQYGRKGIPANNMILYVKTN